MENIVIAGSSGHVKVIIDIVQTQAKYNIAGLLDPNRSVGEDILGHLVLGDEEDLPRLIKTHSLTGVFVAIGDNFIRSEVATRIKNMCPDLSFVNAIHPGAAIAASVSIGEGTAIMAGVSINPCTSIGQFCILNTNASLDHDSVMENFSSLGPGTTTGGNCRIGEYSAIGIGAVLTHGISIGEHTVIGAASLVTRHIAPGQIAYGSPAAVIRTREVGDKYL